MAIKPKVKSNGNKHKHYNKILTYEDFVDYCLRKLGAPVIEINVDPMQLQDRVSDAIQVYIEYDLESVAECWWIHRVSAEDVANGYLSIPLDVLDVMQILYANGFQQMSNEEIMQNSTSTITGSYSSSSSSSFSTEQSTAGGSSQIITGTTSSPFGYPTSNSSGTTSYYGSPIMSNAQHLNMAIYGDPGFGSDMYMTSYLWNWWNSYWNYSCMNYGGGMGSGNAMSYYEVNMQYISMMENLFQPCIEYLYRRRQRKLWLYSYKQPLTEGALICLYGTKVLDPETDDCIWDSDWLKAYATALIGIQWGTNLSKFGDIPTAGGITISGDAILQRYMQEKEMLEERFMLSFVEPPMPTFGSLNA